MTKKRKFSKTVLTIVEALSGLFIALYLTGWDIHTSLYSFVWDYQFLRLYGLISLSIFALLNFFGLFEFLIDKNRRSISTSNLGGVYCYLIGTILYLLFFEFIREYSLRAFALAIPVMLTTIGFNYYQVDMSVLNTKKRLILVINIIVLVFLAVIGYYLYIRLDYDQSEHESAMRSLDDLEERFFNRADSMYRVVDPQTAYVKFFDEYDNDTLRDTFYAQVELYREYLNYREGLKYGASHQMDNIWDYHEMRQILTGGIVCVVLLNVIYLIYLYRDR